MRRWCRTRHTIQSTGVNHLKNTKRFSLLVALCIAAGTGGCSLSKDKDGSKSAEEIKEFSGFFAAQGTSMVMSEDNTMQKLISEKIGAKCNETWLSEGDDASKSISDMILSGKYPDFLYAGNEQHQKLMHANAYIPIDEYWDEYPNLKNYFTESEWNRIRAEDGHIYIIPTFSNRYLYDTETVHNDEAFWLQVKVLQWAGYPEIVTLDDYFDVIERYVAANPLAADGQPNIGYEILSDGWLYFCLENPPMFLDGYPNDGCCCVDPEKLEALDYNTTPTAKRWFQKLNEEYAKGIIDPECFVLTADQYFEKIKSGRVLGMVDQHWNFNNATNQLPADCTYVPLGLVIDEGIESHYHSNIAMDTSQGLGISVSCEDVEGAVKFINDLLDPEILTLRFWGLEGKDYSVDEDGLFYITDEQRAAYLQEKYSFENRCSYAYFPFYGGMNHDGINAYNSEHQPSEFYKTLDPIVQECFTAYGVQTYVELLNQAGENPPWFPMWSYSNTFTPDTPYGKAKADMDTVKHQHLPRVVAATDFEAAWKEYMAAYTSQCDTDAYLTELTNEIRRRAEK